MEFLIADIIYFLNEGTLKHEKNPTFFLSKLIIIFVKKTKFPKSKMYHVIVSNYGPLVHAGPHFLLQTMARAHNSM